MTRQFQVYLDPSVSLGSQGRAYLFDKAVNVKSAGAEDRLLLTGQHRVADLHCAGCNSLLGWKYERAFEASQRYKEGKYIIELAHLIKENRWTENSAQPLTFSSPSSGYHSGGATSPAYKIDEVGQRNDAFAVDSSGDEEATPSLFATQNPDENVPPEYRGTLRRTIENTSHPEVTFQQTSPQLNPGTLEWSDLPLNDDSFLAHSFSTYEIAPSRSANVGTRRAAPCLFQPSPYRSSGRTSVSPSSGLLTVPLLSAAEEPAEPQPTASVLEELHVSSASLLPSPSYAMEAIQNSCTTDEVFSAALE
uniref:Yippee domain-containing protein n=1 Tax=Mesocestoides corti TaxID=53468 RepID=A0A5K3F4U4_MESCO